MVLGHSREIVSFKMLRPENIQVSKNGKTIKITLADPLPFEVKERRERLMSLCSSGIPENDILVEDSRLLTKHEIDAINAASWFSLELGLWLHDSVYVGSIEEY